MPGSRKPTTAAESRRFARFVVSGALNTALTYALFVALELAMPYLVAYAIAYAAGIALSYAVTGTGNRLDLSRVDNAHLAFGAGVHHCLGVTLARIETAIAIGTLLRRMPRLQLATETPQWRDSSLVRGLAALPVTF